MKNKRLKIFLGCNILLLIFELIGLVWGFSEIGVKGLVYYTQLSNILLAVAAIVNIFYATKALRNRAPEIPLKVWKLFHTAVSAIAMTFLVALLVLTWMYGDFMYIMATRSMLYTHTLCPLLALATFLIFAPKEFTKQDALKALSFTLLYGFIIVTLNILKVLEGPYPFLLVYQQPVWTSILWAIGIVGGAYLVSRLLILNKTKN